MRLYVFPAAFMANTFAMMLVMIGLSVFGNSELAADFGIVHGATVALFYSLSGNARSLILSGNHLVGSHTILRMRCLLLLPVTGLAFLLCAGVVEVGWIFSLLLIGRRACEWLAEIFLSEQELEGKTDQALYFLLTQGVVSLLFLMAMVLESPMQYGVLLLWSISPLCWCFRLSLFSSAGRLSAGIGQVVKNLLPHFGSTAVVGVSVYVFRLFIILLAGKEVAGDLFTAFAVGGILGAVFTQALGPTLVRNEVGSQRIGRANRLLRLTSWLSCSLGLLLISVVALMPSALEWAQKSSLFWSAVGCSLVGSVVMVRAQFVRLRILQDASGKDVFGSDMLANILLVICVPFFYYWLGVASLAVLYLCGAGLSLMFYVSENNGLFSGSEKVFRISDRWLLSIVAFGLFFPLFFQLSSGIFHDQALYFNSGGRLAMLPIPLSVIACYVGILLLGGYARARLALTVVFIVFMGMLFATILLAAKYGGQEQAKLILLVQYVLPVFALVLGQQYGGKDDAIRNMSKVFLFVLLLVVPVQLLATYVQGLSFLSPSLFLFSVFQHLQYLPVIFVGGFLVAVFTLWGSKEYRLRILILATFMGVYVSLSLSMLATGLLFLGLVFFAVYKSFWRDGGGYAATVMALAVISSWLTFVFLANPDILAAKLGFGISVVGGVAREGTVGALEGGRGVVPQNITERVEYWDFYLAGITQDWISMFFGHLGVPNRDQYPSAHNYYIDFIYNFGFLAILPLLWLIGYTVFMLIRNFMPMIKSSETVGVAGVVLFILLVDNMLKVGLRQPYSGIMTFFLWGVLLAVLLRFKERAQGTVAASA